MSEQKASQQPLAHRPPSARVCARSDAAHALVFGRVLPESAAPEPRPLANHLQNEVVFLCCSERLRTCT